MKPYRERTPDQQYADRLKYILENGLLKNQTIQGTPQIVCLHVPSMIFDLQNGAPLITERKISFWRSAIGEICAFINGARTQKELESFGCTWWKSWTTEKKCKVFDLTEGDLGPASYGPAFRNYPTPDGGKINQFEAIIEQIKEKPYLATHDITPWIPGWIIGPKRKAVVAPCHGWCHFEVINERLHLIMRQRSADFPIGVPSNMIQYAALLIMLAKVTGYEPGTFVHQFCNAHIYVDQIPAAEEMIRREPRRLPTLTLKSTKNDLLSFRADDFVLTDYNPHPAIKDISVSI